MLWADTGNPLLAKSDRGAAASRNMEAPQYVAGRWLDGHPGRARPRPVVSCGAANTYLTVGETVYSWGGNHNGQLGFNIKVESVPSRPATAADRTNMVKRSSAVPEPVPIDRDQPPQHPLHNAHAELRASG